jgi:hypothetical protein
LGESKLDIDDETVMQVRRAVEANASKTQIDPQLTNLILEQIGGVNEEVRKGVVIRALLAYTWTQRLYFIVRSTLMGIISAGVTTVIVLVLREVDAVQVVIIGIFSFLATLAITRLFDLKIFRGSKRIVSMLSHHRRLHAAILNHL